MKAHQASKNLKERKHLFPLEIHLAKYQVKLNNLPQHSPTKHICMWVEAQFMNMLTLQCNLATKNNF
jgi:hypothetical protein